MAVTRITGKNIKDLSITDADVAAANKDGAAATPSMRTLGTGAAQATAGNDSRLTDDRTASGIRTATTVVAVSAAAAPTVGQVLVATGASAASWQTLTASVAPADLVYNEVPTGTVNGVNTTFTIANTPQAGTLRVYLNGLRMIEGASDDYTFSGTTITFNATQIPETGDVLVVDYLK